jgi:hypothetical protein
MRKPLHALAALAAAALALQPAAIRAEATTASVGIATQCLPCVEMPKGELTDAQLRELVPDDAPGRVFIRWRTETQEDNYGFNILRASAPGAAPAKVNKSIIPGEGSTNIPKEYCLMDVGLPRGTTWYYTIESVSNQGRREVVEGTLDTKVTVKTVAEEREWLRKKARGESAPPPKPPPAAASPAPAAAPADGTPAPPDPLQ